MKSVSDPLSIVLLSAVVSPPLCDPGSGVALAGLDQFVACSFGDLLAVHDDVVGVTLALERDQLLEIVVESLELVRLLVDLLAEEGFR